MTGLHDVPTTSSRVRSLNSLDPRRVNLNADVNSFWGHGFIILFFSSSRSVAVAIHPAECGGNLLRRPAAVAASEGGWGSGISSDSFYKLSMLPISVVVSVPGHIHSYGTRINRQPRGERHPTRPFRRLAHIHKSFFRFTKRSRRFLSTPRSKKKFYRRFFPTHRLLLLK